MKTVIQRVLKASVSSGSLEEKIHQGLLILVGLETNDTFDSALKSLKKIPRLRIFEDDQGKTNLSLIDIKGELLWISQFTLAADLKSGNRPSFITAMPGNIAADLFEKLIHQMAKDFPDIVQKKGFFGEDMKVSLVNDGPFTLIFPQI